MSRKKTMTPAQKAAARWVPVEEPRPEASAPPKTSSAPSEPTNPATLKYALLAAALIILVALASYLFTGF